VAGFDGLRSDAYEKQVAAGSVDDLERVYEALLDPALGFKEMRERCPAWPEGSRLAGKLPSMMTLREIKERILLEWKVQDRLKHSGFVERLQEVGLDDEELMQAANMILGEELLSAKLDGTPISENLRVLDRMLRIAGVQLRQRTQKRQQAQADWKREQDKRKLGNDEARMANDECKARTEVSGSRVQVSGTGTNQSGAGLKFTNDETKGVRKPIIVGKKDEGKTKSGLILETGYEPLNWLPSLQKKDSLAELIIGGPNSW